MLFRSFDGNVALVRLNANGTLDTSFDGDGRVVFPMANDQSGFSLAVDPSGRIVVAGETTLADGSTDIAVWRFTSAGAPDTGFSGDGLVTQDFGGTSDLGSAVIVQADGRIVVGGSNSQEFGKAVLIRYNTDGTLDTRFDGDGVFTGYIDNGTSAFNALALAPNGDLIAGGKNFSGVSQDFAVMRFGALAGTLQASAGSAFSYTVPTDAFYAPDGSPLTLSASLAGGGALQIGRAHV